MILPEPPRVAPEKSVDSATLRGVNTGGVKSKLDFGTYQPKTVSMRGPTPLTTSLDFRNFFQIFI